MPSAFQPQSDVLDRMAVISIDQRERRDFSMYMQNFPTRGLIQLTILCPPGSNEAIVWISHPQLIFPQIRSSVQVYVLYDMKKVSFIM